MGSSRLGADRGKGGVWADRGGRHRLGKFPDSKGQPDKGCS